MEGTVARLIGEKGYGFIKGEDSKDYFFHRQDFNGHFDDLVTDFQTAKNLRVTFEWAPSPKGLRASNVTRTDYPNQAV